MYVHSVRLWVHTNLTFPNTYTRKEAVFFKGSKVEWVVWWLEDASNVGMDLPFDIAKTDTRTLSHKAILLRYLVFASL